MTPTCHVKVEYLPHLSHYNTILMVFMLRQLIIAPIEKVQHHTVSIEIIEIVKTV